jgi:hypothetical protein
MFGISRRCLVTLFILGSATAGMTDPVGWTLGTTGPSARYRCGSASDGTYIYVFGGSDAGQTILAELWRWDPATGSWTELAPMPTAKMNHQGVYYDGKIYVPGGYTGTHIDEMAIYDITTDSWSLGTPEPALRTGTTVAYDGKVYVFAGNPGPSTETLIYNIATDSWSYGAAMPVATTYGRAIAVGDYAYYIGGVISSSTSAVHRYDFADDSWVTVSPLQTARMSPELMADGMHIYAVNGGGDSIWDGVPSAETVEIYDIATDTWSYGLPTVETSVGVAGGLAGGKFMVIGGTSAGTTYDTVQVAENVVPIFTDGFENGDTLAWNTTAP